MQLVQNNWRLVKCNLWIKITTSEKYLANLKVNLQLVTKMLEILTFWNSYQLVKSTT